MFSSNLFFITTLGLIVGLNSVSHSKIIVLGGILVIAITDALSDAFGIHISEESVNKNKKQIWESSASTFITKFLVALTFTIPIILFQLSLAIIISIIWGLLLITLFSIYLANKEKIPAYKVIAEHILLAIFVIIITYLVGSWINSFNSI